MLRFLSVYIFLSFLTITVHSQSVFVNEINYLGTAPDEGFGIAGPAGTVIDGWSLVFYLSSGSVDYIENLDTRTIPDAGVGYGEVWYDVAMVNEPSAFAVVNNSGQLVQFLSYGAISTINYQVQAIEGVATQANPALSTWVGDAAPGSSLQLVGLGLEYGDFAWLLPSGGEVSRGAINAGQTFLASLPIELLSFEAEILKTGHQLTWITSSETNNDYFVLEKSIDGLHFEDLHQVESKNNSLQKTTYQYLDKSSISEAFYYRLRQVDKNGATEFSPVVFSSPKTTTIAVQTFPNPTVDELNVSIATLKDSPAIVNIINTEGQIVQRIRIENPTTFLNIDTQTLTSGRYFLQIRQAQQTYLSSFIKY